MATERSPAAGTVTVGSHLGRYEIQLQIGVGAFGSVFKAWDPLIQRDVAIKTCGSDRAEVRERFAREARLAGGLDHENIVRIYDLQLEEEPPFIVQEYLEGEDLDRRLSEPDGLSLDERFRILDDVAAALAAAHAQGIVHRDIKPANVRVLPDGRAKVLDFGIAKAVDDRSATDSGLTVGSAAYMAPEQVQGAPVDARSDLFALGIVAYELFAGRSPFAADNVAEAFEKIAGFDPPAPSRLAPGLPAELDAAILQALAKDPAARPASVEDFRQALARAREVMPPDA